MEKRIELQLSANVKNNKSLMCRVRGQTRRMSNLQVYLNNIHTHTCLHAAICICNKCLQHFFLLLLFDLSIKGRK